MSMIGRSAAVHHAAAQEPDISALPVRLGRLLRELHEAAAPPSIGMMAETMGIDRPKISKVVNSALRRGFVQLLPADGDRRLRLLRLTPAGRDICIRTFGPARIR